MSGFGKLIILIVTIVVVVEFDERVLFPAIFQFSSPLDWFLIVIVSGLEFAGTIKLFK